MLLIRTCAYQGVQNVSFSENFAYVVNDRILQYMDFKLPCGYLMFSPYI